MVATNHNPVTGTHTHKKRKASKHNTKESNQCTWGKRQEKKEGIEENYKIN